MATVKINTVGSNVTNGTTGSVLFVGPGGALGQDSTNFFWDDTNHSLNLSGTPALYKVPNGSGDNWFIGGAGNFTASSFKNIGIGGGVLSSITSGRNNVAFGANSLNSITTNINNVAVGVSSLVALTTGGTNYAIGGSVLELLQSGSNNIGIGNGAWNVLGDNSINSSTNIAIGILAGANVTDGDANVLIGNWEGPSGTLSGAIALSDGNGALKLDYGVTSAGKWTFAAPPVVPAFTVSTLPTGVAGAQAYVTNADAGLAWGATAINSGAGATKYLVWYNGANWTVVGK